MYFFGLVHRTRQSPARRSPLTPGTLAKPTMHPTKPLPVVRPSAVTPGRGGRWQCNQNLKPPGRTVS